MRPIVDLVTGVDDLRFEVVPGGHLGMLTGRAARATTWRIIDEWIDAHSSADADRPRPRPARSARPEGRGGEEDSRPATAAATAKKARGEADGPKAPKKASKTAIGANPAAATARPAAAPWPPKKK